MTKAQKKLKELREKQSRERQRMAEIGLADELTDETRSELDTIENGIPDLERRLRAAQVALDLEEQEQHVETRDAEPDTEMRERIELRSKASLTNYLLAASAGRAVAGAEAELNAAAKVGNAIPVELWDTPQPSEQRVDAATGTPATVGINMDPIRPAVFAQSIAPRLGIAMPRVMSGTFASATISTSLSAAAKNKGDAQESTGAMFDVSTATPKRVSARLSVRLEDIAAVGAENFESALRENLSMTLSDELDDQVVNGNGTAPNLAGILSRFTSGTNPTAVADFDAFVAAFAGAVDGLWASTVKDVSIVTGPATYQLSARTFRDIAAADLGAESFADYAMRLYGGWWTNARMPAAASNIQKAILHRRGRMGMRTAVCPHWGEVGIDDIYSGSASGERHFTLHVLLGDVILVQPDAYAEREFKVA